MSELFLRAMKYLDGANLGGGALANVLAFDGQGRRTPTSDVRDVVVPVGLHVDPVSVPVRPGDYLVELRLPNGERTSVEVRAGDAPVLVDLDVTHSPREWLSWQHLMGSVPPPDEVRRIPESIVGGEPTPGEPGGAGWGPDDREPARVEWVLGSAWTEHSWADPWRAAILPLILGDRPPPRGEVLPAPWPELGWTRYRIGVQGGLDPSMREDPYWGPADDRRYLTVFAGAATWLVPAPVPWATRAGDVAVDVLVQNDPGAAQVTLSPFDPEIGPALAYLMRGDASDARLLIDHVEAKDLLFRKIMNPLAAAAGGYVLLATEETGDTEWHPWIHNLAEWFDWLPDGAIQAGRLLLRHRRGRDDVERARAAFLSAYSRGLPFYTLGLLWLVDGLAMFADSGDGEAREMLAAVQEASWHADLAQSFTTLRLSDR